MVSKKVAAGIIAFVFSAFCAFSEVSITEFSFAPEIGFLNGKIIENVWNARVTQSGKTITYTPTTKMSRLDWQLDNSVFFGATTAFTFNDKINCNFSFKNAFAKVCGVMEDYDWLNISDPDYLSRYSCHTNNLDTFTQVDFTIGRIFYIGRKKSFSITPHFGFETQIINFSGTGGWRTYDTDNWKKINFSEGKVISYSQVFAAPVLKLCTDFNFLKYFETTLDLSAIFIEDLDCLDIHHLRSATFNDRIQDTWKFEGELGLFFKFLQMNKIGIKGNVSYIPESYGFTYSSYTENKPDPSTMGGTSRFLWSYSFVYVFYF